ncbi:hypothetical protein BT96DRAFT_522869 [Gymnopus androsaceus JB14]|uniref:Uncharacterized protein n=1 Tax=Gymnopus androsaceus JB14 TaxID=1447944 RepID=A0A6A4GLR6_9AGAR|nr:hypothetical protein BT96DRAFT_522869 [Gymnopus androsaceus JB14]
MRIPRPHYPAFNTFNYIAAVAVPFSLPILWRSHKYPPVLLNLGPRLEGYIGHGSITLTLSHIRYTLHNIHIRCRMYNYTFSGRLGVIRVVINHAWAKQ